jgi:FkbM family methyltransferase
MNDVETEISISDLKKFWIPNSAQVIHCGAHLAEESDDYISNGFNNIVWIEAMPEIFSELHKKVSLLEGNLALNACLWSRTRELLEFKVSSNSYSSSILDFGTHSVTYPEIKWERSIKLMSSTLDSLELPPKIDPLLLVLDLQGAEFQALMGGNSVLRDTDFIYVEVSKNQLYKNSTNWDEITQFLKVKGFKLVDWQYSTKLGWGNALYIKNAPKIKCFILRKKRLRSHKRSSKAPTRNLN